MDLVIDRFWLVPRKRIETKIWNDEFEFFNISYSYKIVCWGDFPYSMSSIKITVPSKILPCILWYKSLKSTTLKKKSIVAA